MKKNLLIIEDESSVAKQLKWGLINEYDIVVASDSHQARQMLGSGRFSVANLDMGLPPFPDDPQEGFKLLQEMPSLAPRVVSRSDDVFFLDPGCVGVEENQDRPVVVCSVCG